MATKFRNWFDDDQNAPGPDVMSAGGGVAAVRAEANHLLRIGDDMIRRTLSGDSESYNRTGRQQSGQ